MVGERVVKRISFARILQATLLSFGILACSLPPRIAQTAVGPEDAGSGVPTVPSGRDAGPSPAPDTPPSAGGKAPDTMTGSVSPTPGQSCPGALDQRLTISTFGSGGANIRYKRPGYDGFPLDDSVLLSVSPSGNLVYVAFREPDLNVRYPIHVVTLDSQLARIAELYVAAYDLGGMVGLDDGSFVLLTRRDDFGEQLRDPNAPDQVPTAVEIIHILGMREFYSNALTGTASITRGRYPNARDCAPALNGARLAWNGTKLAAYFPVHGCQGDSHESLYGDKLVYLDNDGNLLPGGWDWNCSISQGMRLLPGPNAFTTFCLSDNAPFAGLNLVTEGTPARLLAPEKSLDGYSGGNFGSVVRMADGTYLIGWLSRGVPDAMTTAKRPSEAKKQAQDIALLHLDANYRPLGASTWLAETPDIAETNLHLAPYGPDRLLVVWDNIETLNCTDLTCWGTYTGTSARLIDLAGNFLTPDVRIDAPPNTDQDIVVFPNGDLGWAFVPDAARNYTMPLPMNRGMPNVPSRTRLSVARLRYCE